MKLRQRHIDQYGESINALRGIGNLHRKISRIKMRNYNVSVSSWRKYAQSMSHIIIVWQIMVNGTIFSRRQTGWVVDTNFG